MKQLLQLFVLSFFIVIATNLNAQTYNGGVWYSFYNEQFDIYTIGEKSIDVFAPTKDSLRFSYEYAGGVTSISPFQKQETDVYESANGITDTQNMTHIGDADGVKRYDVYTSMPVSQNINKIVFKRAMGNTYGVNYKQVNILLDQHILWDEGEYGVAAKTYGFGILKVGETASVTIPLRSFLTADNITISSDNPVFRVGNADNQASVVWNVGANACASKNGVDGINAGDGVLGDISQYSVTIYFCPDYVKDYTGTITLTDGTSTATIAVSGVGSVEQKYAQEIIWEQDLVVVNVFDTVVLSAEAKTEVMYVVSDSTIASVDGNVLVLYNAGKVEVCAYAVEDAMYLADTLARTVVVSPLAQEIVWVMDTMVMTVGDTLMLKAVATSGLEVSYLTDVDSIVLIESGMMIAMNPGEVVVTALQEGNNNYLAAEIVGYAIAVVAAEEDGDVTTGFENVLEKQDKAHKIIRDGKIYITRGEQVYDLLGSQL